MNEVEEIAARRIEVLREIYESPTPELKAEFEKLNERMIELCPRVHPDQRRMLDQSLNALKRARSQMDELDRLIAER